ncbi:unnamed protein product [Mytilus coruscus]|uniref:SGNH hydrolase-type esterase domain-containing protein n=1 Tax=Mytilus coruscus TaxID=42192 RepID=A0A6J8B0H3_MYTCO|nr:unnamed protein product [Mytilus coruscus]
MIASYDRLRAVESLIMTTADQNNEITGDKHKVNITSYDLSFNSVYKDYPKQCFPDKLSKPVDAKAKELQYEVLDDNIVQQVIEHNTPTDIQVEGSDEHFTDDQETTAKTLVDTTDQPFIKNDENAELKCKLKNQQHTNTLEQQIIKSELDAKYTILKTQFDNQKDTIQKLNTDIGRISSQLADKSATIDNLQTEISSKNSILENKDMEILSLKIHDSRDDRSEFQQAPTRNLRRRKPHVTIIGTSNIKEETTTEIKQLAQAPSVLVLHLLTNELRTKEAKDCVEYMSTMVNFTQDEYPDTLIVISLSTPRKDSDELNFKGQMITLMIKERLRTNKNVSFCDNSNMSYKGEALPRFIDDKDGFHLTPNGTAVLASNIRDSIDNILDLPKCVPKKQNGNRGRGNPYYRGQGGGRGRGGYRRD